MYLSTREGPNSSAPKLSLIISADLFFLPDVQAVIDVLVFEVKQIEVVVKVLVVVLVEVDELIVAKKSLALLKIQTYQTADNPVQFLCF